jgi:Kef-type K+ transport system membrane component KefB/Trk K+ transport system NAD-binding subunit
MEESSSYQLLLISGLAVFVPIIASRLPGRFLPAVVAEIIAGVVIGASGFNLIDPTPVLTFLAGFGFAYLMFLSGLELDFALLASPVRRERREPMSLLRSPVPSASLLFLGTMAVSLTGVALLELAGLAPDIWLTTLILSTTSVGLVMPTLKEATLSTRPYGQVIIIAAFVADFVTLFLISVFAAIKRGGEGGELIFVLALPLAFLVVYFLGSTMQRYRILSRTLEELSEATAQIHVRGAVALMLAFAVIAQAIGTELILGSFIAGVIVSLLSREQGSTMRLKLDAIGYGFFIPIFFINVGADLDLRALSGSAREMSLVPLFLLIAYASKVVPSLILRLQFSWRESLAAGVLLSARLSLIIAASLIGLELGIISPGVNSAIILVAVVTSSVSPVAFSMLMKGAIPREHMVIIVGAGETGRSLASRLAGHGAAIVLVDSDAAPSAEATSEGFSVVRGEGSDIAVLRGAGAERATSLVAVTPDDELNLLICARAKEVFDIPQLVARVNDPANQQEFTKAGIRAVSVPASASAALEHAVLRPNLFHLLVDRPKEYDVVEVSLNNRAIAGRALKDVRLPGNCLILLIRRDGGLVVPRGSTVLQARDQVTLAGDAESAREAAQLLGGRPSRGEG